MLTAFLLALLQQTPDAHYAGGATSRTAGTTAQAGQLFRFLFSTVPQWVQLAGILIGVPVAIIVLWQMVKRRRAIWAWWLSRTRAAQVAMATAIIVIGSAGLFSGLYGYNYMMHENDFCQSCHVMDAPWNRFQATAHKNLQCHACHRQPMYVSSIELFWWVLERRMTIPPHDKVPTAVCSECHMRAGTDSARTLITLTAGHALHFKSDSSALKKIECTSCHGRDFHQFKPTSFSCTQSGCHFNQKVSLGEMSSKGFMHCTSCHDFKGRIPPGTTPKQAKLALIPRAMDCGSCHGMSDKIRSFDLAADPHKGNCGMCHDVHKQEEPKAAFKTCATAQCHSSADTLTAFHRGLGNHAIDQCGACHQAHSWKVKGTNCLACHKNINQDRPAVRRTSAVPDLVIPRRSPRRDGARLRFARLASFNPIAAPAPRSRPPSPPPPQQRQDPTFPHSRHQSVTCTTCHSTTDTHGGLNFTRPAGCTACHHSARQTAPCSACHAASARAARPVDVRVAISARRDPVTRPITFAHERHAKLACARCHANDLKRTPATTCAGCHADHHVATADCAGCHPTARTGHDRLAHEGCASCHTDARVASLPASRPVCLACHQEQRTHYPSGDCATCHALADHGMMGAKSARAGAQR